MKNNLSKRLEAIENKLLEGQGQIVGLMFIHQHQMYVGTEDFPARCFTAIEDIPMEIRSLPQFAHTNIKPGEVTQGEPVSPEFLERMRIEGEEFLRIMKKYA